VPVTPTAPYLWLDLDIGEQLLFLLHTLLLLLHIVKLLQNRLVLPI
jgi:hypothetical protein